MAEADWLKDLPDDLNPYAVRLRQQPALGVVSLSQRFGANVTDSFSRGTLAGSADLLEMQRIATMTPEAWADYSKARRVLGWSTRVALRDGLTQTYRWIEQRIPKD